MATAQLKNYLKALSKEDLIKHVIELDKKYKSVQEYHDMVLNGDVEGVVVKYKKQIENEFYPARGLPKMRLSFARKAIADAKKLGVPADSLADLMLFYVEVGIKFTNDYGDNNEAFYNSMEGMFEKALKLMKKEGLLTQYYNRSKSVLPQTENIGWGFYDTLSFLFFEYYCD